jgi:hypothetical protein
MKLDLLTNATVVDDAVRFTLNAQDKPYVTSEKKHKKVLGPDYDEKLEDELKKEDGEILTTINKVF